MINTLLSALQLPREGQEFTVHPDLIGVFLPGLIFLWAETCLGHETGRPLVNPESTKTWSVSYIDPSLCSHPANHLTLSLSLSLSFFFSLALGPAFEARNRQNRLHLENRIPSWPGPWTLSYMPRIFGDDIATGKPDPPRWKSPRARPRLSVT